MKHTYKQSHSFMMRMLGKLCMLSLALWVFSAMPTWADNAETHTLQLKASPTKAGSFNTSSASLAAGRVIHLYAYANSNFDFKEWTDENGNIVSDKQDFEYTMPTRDVTLTAVFKYNPVNPGNPHKNYWNAATGEVIVDDFKAGGLSQAIRDAIGSNTSYSSVKSITAAGVMNNSDFNVINNYSYCTMLDISRTSGFTTIPSYAFDYTRLQTVVLPSSVERIGYKAFYQCTQLSRMTVYALTPPVLESYALQGVRSDMVVYVPLVALQQYKEAAGWKNFTILPIQEELRTLKVVLPEASKASDYANMYLELTNTKSGQRQHFVMTNQREYAFSSVIKNTVWNVTLKNERGDLFGEIRNVEVKDNDVTVSFKELRKPQDVKIKVLTPEGQDVTSQTSITWFDQAGTYLSQAAHLSSLPNGMKLNCQVDLQQQALAMKYTVPAHISYTLKDGINLLTCQLSPLPQVTIKGRVKNGKTSLPMNQALVTASQTFNGKFGNTLTALTDAQGYYELTIPKVSTTLTFAYSDFISQTISCDTLTTHSDTLQLADVTLKAIEGATITVDVKYQPCNVEGTTESKQELYQNYKNIAFSVFNKTKQHAVENYSLQYPSIVLLEETAVGDEFVITATSKTDDFMPTQATAVLNENLNATAQFNIIEKGGLRASFSQNDNKQVTGSLYDAQGHLLRTDDFKDAQLSISLLSDGNYTLVTMGKSSLFNTIYNLNQLSNTGLTAGTDYVVNTFKVESGKLTSIAIKKVPTLNEAKLYYTNGNTSFTANKSEIIIGNYLTLTARLDFKPEYAKNASNINIIVDLPKSCSFVENSVMAGRTIGRYLHSGSRITIPLARVSDLVRFCVIPTTGGDYSPSAFVQFVIDGKTITQPIGAANYTAKNLSISVPEVSAQENISISGVAPALSDIQIYDNDVLIGQVQANSNGTWSTTCTLNNAYNLSNHSIQAKTTTKQGLTLLSDVVDCQYDVNAIYAKTVNMSFYNRWLRRNVEVNFYLVNQKSDVSSYMFYTGTNITFTVDLSNNDPQKVKSVTVRVYTSDKKWVNLSASYDKRKNKWVAVGYFGGSCLPTGVKVSFVTEPTNASVQIDADNIRDIFTSLPQKLAELKAYKALMAQYVNAFDKVLSDEAIASPKTFTAKFNAFLVSIGEDPIGPLPTDMTVTEEDLSKLTSNVKQLLKRNIIAQLDSLIALNVNSLEKIKPYLNGIELTRTTGMTEAGLLAQGYRPFSKTDGTYLYVMFGGNNYDIVDLSIGLRLKLKADASTMSNGLVSQSGDDFVLRMNAACESIKNYCDMVSSSLQAVAGAISSLEGTLIASNNALASRLEELYIKSNWLVNNGRADLFKKYALKAQIKEAWAGLRSNQKILEWVNENLKQFKVGTNATKLFGAAALVFDLYSGITSIKKVVELHKKCLPCKDDEANARAIQKSLEVLGTETAAFYLARSVADVAAIISANSGIFAAISTGGASLAAVGISVGLVAANYVAGIAFNKYFDMSIQSAELKIKALKCNKKKNDDNNDDDTPPRPLVTPIHDPSGYVYESVLSNRLEGVKATAYYKETVEDMYGDMHENIVKWNAEEYAQKNPLFTDENGYYQWDVPQGMWQVKFEKEGYETTYSEWLPVPPPQLDVNIAMKQNVQPQVKDAKAYDDAVEVVFSKYMDTATLTTDNVQVVVDGTPIEGTIELKDAEEDYTNNSRMYATKLRFNAAQPFDGSEVTLVVKNQVKSYADVRMAADFMQNFTISHEAKRIVCDSLIDVVYGQAGNIQLEVLPAAAAMGKEVEVSLSSDLILSTTQTSCTLDENGRATVSVNGELPGMAAVTFHVVGTELTATTLISVVQPITVEAPTASHASGSTVESGTGITLACETEDAQIYYTLDGSCPCEETAARHLYDGNPIILTSSTQLKAMAVLDGVESEVVTFLYKVDYLNEAKTIVEYEKTIPANAIGSFEQVEELKDAIAANNIALCKSLVNTYKTRTAPTIEAGFYRLINAQDRNYLTPYVSGNDILMRAGTEEKGISNVFEFVPTTTDGQFVIKANGCRVSKCYTTALGSSGANFMLIDENSEEEGHFSFENAQANALFLIAENATTTSGYHNYLFEDNGNAIGWDKVDNNGVGHPSAWYIVPATEAEVALTTVGDASYASAYLPFNASHVEGAKVYYGILNEEHTIMDMYATAGITARKGVVLIGPADAEKATLTIGEADTFDSSLSGTLNELTLTSDTRANYLIFGVNDGKVGFYRPNSALLAITANKAFLYNTFGSAAIAMRFNGSIVGISDVITINVTDAPIFDLSGRRVSIPVKGGVYIQNGHKFIK